MDSGCILKVELTGFLHRLDEGCEKKGIKTLSFGPEQIECLSCHQLIWERWNKLRQTEFEMPIRPLNGDVKKADEYMSPEFGAREDH